MSIFRRQNIPTLIAVVISLNGFVNLVTGVAPLFRMRLMPEQLEGMTEYLQISSGQQLSGMVSVVFGLLLVGLGKGLYERRRLAWMGALGVVTLLLLNNLYRWTTPQTAMLSAILLVGLLAFRRHFDAPSDSGFDLSQAMALFSVVVALGYGIGGSYVLRDQFNGIETWTDAVYFTFVTYSTLGYGDVLPNTSDAKLFVISMILIGLTSFVTALTVVLGPLIERRMKGVLSLMSRFQRTTDHVVICGFSNVAESVIDELQDRNISCIVVEDREDILYYLQSKGYDVLNGDAARTETLIEANLKDARALVAVSDSDSVNTLVGVTAKEYRDTLTSASYRIVVRVEDEENIEKVSHIGVDEVISPSTMAGRLMAQRALALSAS